MSQDLSILTEDLLDLRAAAREVPRPRGVKPISYQTVWRWTKRGVRGHRLETVRIGQQHMTSRQRLHAFLQAIQREATTV